MAASSTSSWLHTTLLSPSSQQESAPHSLYGSDLPMHASSHQQQQQQMGLGQDGHRSCTAFCSPLPCAINNNLDFHQSGDSHQLPDFSRPAGGSCSGHGGTGCENGGPVFARKAHKADREKLRRDRLNEQFAELAGVLDPDRPKNDKATILGDSVQVVKELRSEVKRLKTEQASLLDESRDLAQEKTELREEKASLKNDTEHIQGQIQQRLRLMLPWMTMDPSMMMGAPPFGYPMAVPQPVSTLPASDLNQPGPQVSLQQSVSTPPPSYISLPPPAASPFTIHPAMQGYTMFANRHSDGSTPYMPYPHYPAQVGSHPHVERPYPQYPSPIQPYLMQMQAHQGQTAISGAPPVSSMYQPFAPSMPIIPSRPQVSQPNVPARGGIVHPVPPSDPCSPSGYADHSVSVSSVQTTLQLQTPVHPQSQKPSQVGTSDHVDEGSKTETEETEPQRENEAAPHDAPPQGTENSIDLSPASIASPGLCSPGSSSTCARGEATGAQGSTDSGLPQQTDLLGTDDAMLRPPAA